MFLDVELEQTFIGTFEKKINLNHEKNTKINGSRAESISVTHQKDRLCVMRKDIV